jgi:hypothetical protein
MQYYPATAGIYPSGAFLPVVGADKEKKPH